MCTLNVGLVTKASFQVALVESAIAPLALALPLTISLVPQEAERLILIVTITAAFREVEALSWINLLPILAFPPYESCEPCHVHSERPPLPGCTKL